MICRRAVLLALLLTSVLGRIGFAAETSLLQATAVYGVIATDPIYLWIAQDRGLFKKNGLNIDLTHIPTTQAVQALVGGKIQIHHRRSPDHRSQSRRRRHGLHIEPGQHFRFFAL